MLRGHSRAVNSAAFSPNGLRIVTASADNSARVWDVTTGRELGLLRGHDRFVNSAAFSPDGSRIVTAAADNTVRIWNAYLFTLSPNDLLTEGCRLVGIRKFSRDEMRLAGYPDSMTEIDACNE